ncbi:MAG: GNAT family N-acetyltransferase [Bacteroidia bacterium]
MNKTLPATKLYKVIEPLTAEEFDEYFYLRWKILRKPWNQSPGSETDLHEQESIHGMIMNNEGQAVAVCRIQMNDRFTAQVRYMAVSDRYRTLGLGRKILEYLEKKVKDKYAQRIYLDARENAVDFYKSCGYKVIRTSYLLFGEIQHFGMEKYL